MKEDTLSDKLYFLTGKKRKLNSNKHMSLFKNISEPKYT